MIPDSRAFDPRRPSRRQLLKAGGLTLAPLGLPRPAWAKTPRPGGVLVSAQTSEATGLDPQLVPALWRSRRSPLTYNQLVRFDFDMNPVPELAESWEVARDGVTWTFKLRQGVKFHDGQEFTSADVKFTFDRLIEKSSGKADFLTVDKFEPVGKHAIKFVTREPFAGLLAALGGFWGFIVSEAGVKKHGDLNKAAVGTGRLPPPATAPMKQWQLPEEQWMPYYRPDPDRAKKLLADAGFANGFTVKLGVIPTFPTMVSGAPVVAAQLKRVGITAEIENVEYAVWIKRWLAKDFDMTMNTPAGYAGPGTAFFRAPPSPTRP